MDPDGANPPWYWQSPGRPYGVSLPRPGWRKVRLSTVVQASDGKQMLDNTNDNNPNDIAIVGMALRVPGARTVDEFWRNLRSGTESIRSLEVEELTQAGESLETIHHPNYVRRTSDLPDMEMFDAGFFGFSPKEASIMDPQHRHFLECAWEALEDAGRMPEDATGPIGVFAGCGMGSYFYFNICSNRALVDQVGMFLLRHTGNDKDFLATRASFTFDLRGPSVNVQTACSTSLVAVHYACQSLLNGECDMALAGGVTIDLPHRRGYLYQEGEILSPDGHCRAFDHRAAGTVFGSGVGVVALRRLSDALADGDIIHGVIKATAINNDGGTKAGYLAPSVTGQASAIVEAMGLAGIEADSIQYVECHGTGTALGDPIEIEALTQAFRQTSNRVGYCRVGSVKSNIGHLDTAAGVVGLIKTTLALKHGEIPPTLNYERPNPSIDFASSPFLVADTLMAWPATQGRRRAAVNSLGVGGTNAHVIVEQPPYRAQGRMAGSENVALLLSARNAAALDRSAAKLANWLADNPTCAINDVAHTLWAGRRRFEQNRVISVRSREDAIAALADSRRAASQVKPEAASGAAFLFPGGGAQYRRMAAALHRDDAAFRDIVEEGLAALPAEASQEIRTAWFEDAQPGTADPLLRPSVQLPAILIVEIAVARLWMRAGIMPAALIGHSMGENAAACIAGVMEFADAVRLVRLRGELFDTIAPGGMLSVPMAADELRAILPENLDLASVNAPGHSVVSGRNEDLTAFAEMLAARDTVATRVPIDIAAHSRMLDVLLPRWEAFLRTLKLRAPAIPIVSNLTGDWLTAEQAMDPAYWVRHLRSTVLFADGMAQLAQDRHRIYIEVGPGKTLSTLVKAQGTIRPEQVINSLPHPEDVCDDALHLLGAMGRAAVTGLPVDTSVLYGKGTPQRLTLPTYAFDHQRYFIEADNSARAAVTEPELVKEPDIARWGYRPAWKQSLADVEADAGAEPQVWLIFQDETGVCASLAPRLRQLGHKVVTVAVSDGYTRRSAEEHALCPELGLSGYISLFRNLAADQLMPTRIVHAWLVTDSTDARPGSNLFHRVQETGFYSLLNLAKALGDFPAAEDLHITVMTSGMQKVGDETLQHPEKATILGPGLVIPREFPGTTVRLIDMEQAVPVVADRRRALPWVGGPPRQPAAEQHVDLLWDDLLAQPASEVVAYRLGKRWTRSHVPFALDAKETAASGLKQGGVYAFTGGLGDIAVTLAHDLVEHYGARIALIGRAALPPRNEWQAYRRQHRSDSIMRGIETVLALESRGAEVLYCCADVTDVVSVEDAVREIQTRFGRIDGVFHAAGVVDDGIILEKTSESVEAVLAPKLIGTRVLHEALQNVELDLLVLFSSTSTVTSPTGQSDYVAANAYLDAYAESAADISGRRTVSLHWGIWNEVGLAARATGSAVERAAISLGETTGPFYRRWAVDETGLACLETDLRPDADWLLNEHRLVSGEAVLPGTAYFEIIAQAAQEHGLAWPIEINDLVMLRPLLVPDGETRTLRTTLERVSAGWRVSVRAGQPGDAVGFVKHAEAMLRQGSGEDARRIDVDKLRARLPAPRRAAQGASLASAQEHHIRFGARWKVLQSESFAATEGLADLVLNSEFHKDIDAGTLVHPALLDIATGFAMPLADAFRQSDVLWAPASYARVVINRPLPDRVVSHAAYVPAGEFGPDYVAFDITIAGPNGGVIFSAERFLMKRLSSDSDLATAPVAASVKPEAAATPSAPMLKLAAQVRLGILPREGFEALVRALGSGYTQPIVSSISLPALCARAAQPRVATPDASALFSRPAAASDLVAPRTPVEAALAGYWKELLGVSDVGVHDNFFDLGGHSLIAVRLFRMVKKQFGVDLPISVLFQAPTIEACAELITAQMPTSETSETAPDEAAEAPTRHLHLTLMHAGRDPKATPLFICAGMFGNILNLRHLAMQIGADRPVYGLQAKGIYGDMAPHETFEEMARDYIAEVRSVQPNGPYLLAGYSGGGITAYEMARQLQEMGETVPHLIMLDTPQTTQPALSFGDRLTMKVQDIQRHGLSYYAEWRANRARWREELDRKRVAETDDPVTSGQFNNERIELAFRRALGRYDVRPWSHPLTVFRPKPEVHYRLSNGRRLMSNRNIVLDDNGWTEHTEQLSVVEVPGDHDSMVLEPHVRVLASRMRRILSEASKQAEVSGGKAIPTVAANKDQPQHLIAAE